MTVNVPTHFVDMYRDNVRHKLQYMGSKLRDCMTTAQYSGENVQVVDYYEAVEMNEVTTRLGPMPRSDLQTDRVWLGSRDYDLSLMVDTFDKLRMMTDPNGPLVDAALKAARRKIDDIIIPKFFAPMKIGRNHNSATEDFDSTNHVIPADTGSSADTGLNAAKLIEARKMFQNLEIDLDYEKLYVGITPNQEAEMLEQAQFVDSDFFTKNGRPVYTTDGKISEWLGFHFKVSTKFEKSGANRLCPVWCHSGMHLGMWSDIKVQVNQRPDIQGIPWQIYVTLSGDATRLEAGRVLQMPCKE